MTTFPKDFLWSASTAATQIEGGWNADGKGESIWDTLVHDSTGKIAHGENADTSIDFYHRWREDVALMKQMGLKAYRFSISWPRVLPEGVGRVNEAGIRFYQDLCDELLKNGIQPLVTLYHWDLPPPSTGRGAGRTPPAPTGLLNMQRSCPKPWQTGYSAGLPSMNPNVLRPGSGGGGSRSLRAQRRPNHDGRHPEHPAGPRPGSAGDAEKLPRRQSGHGPHRGLLPAQRRHSHRSGKGPAEIPV